METLKKYAMHIKRTFQLTFRFYGENDMSVYAANAALFLEISAFPLIILLLSTEHLFPTVNPDLVRNFLTNLFPDVPAISETVTRIAVELEQSSSATVSVVSAIVTLFSASNGVSAIMKGLRALYGYSQKGKNLKYRVASIAYTIVILFLAVFSIATELTADIALKLINENPDLSFLTPFADAASRALKYCQLFVLVGSFLMLLSLYIFPFVRKARIRDQIPGALFAILGWLVASKIFAVSIGRFLSSSLIYGSLTAVLLISFWIIILMSILFLGASFNRALEEQKFPDFLDRMLRTLPKLK